MNIAFYSAVTGMKAFQQELDIMANNMANVNTVGYKPLAPSFNDLLYTNMNTKEEHKTGHGTRITDTDYMFGQGLLKNTGRNLDFAIAGDSYFALDNGGNNPVFTRDGTFRVGKGNDDKYYLMSQDGSYVLSATQKRIEITMYNGTNTPNLVGITRRIGMYKFKNPYGLRPLGDNQVAETENSGGWNIVPNSAVNRILSGCLESSKVEISSEMIDMIQAQRAFQMNSRIVQTADQVEEMINNLR